MPHSNPNALARPTRCSDADSDTHAGPRGYGSANGDTYFDSNANSAAPSHGHSYPDSRA